MATYHSEPSLKLPTYHKINNMDMWEIKYKVNNQWNSKDFISYSEAFNFYLKLLLTTSKTNSR